MEGSSNREHGLGGSSDRRDPRTGCTDWGGPWTGCTDWEEVGEKYPRSLQNATLKCDSGLQIVQKVLTVQMMWAARLTPGVWWEPHVAGPVLRA